MSPVGVAGAVSFPAFPVRHGFSTAELGSMGLTGAADPAAVIERRRRLAQAIGFDLDRAALAEQVHGAAVHSFHREDGLPGGQTVRRTDVLTSDVPGQALLTFHADCYPLLALDQSRGAVGAAHAGWRGTLEGAGEALVRALERSYGSRASDLQVLIGPGICGNCYQVGPELVAAFRERFADAERSLRPEGDRARLDLAAALRLQLEGAGVAPNRIMSMKACTREDGRWFSHRGGRSGRFLSVIVAP